MGISGVDMESCVTEAAGLLGYESLKDEQRDCIIGFLNRRDVFAVLPTGFGKTACFTCLPHAFDRYEDRADDNKAIIIISLSRTISRNRCIINQGEGCSCSII